MPAIQRAGLEARGLVSVVRHDARHTKVSRKNTVKSLQALGERPIDERLAVMVQEVEEERRQGQLGAKTFDIQSPSKAPHCVLKRERPSVSQERDHLAVED